MAEVITNPLAPKLVRDGAWLGLAVEVLGDLEHYMRQASPKIPAEVIGEMTDRELVDKVTKCSSKKSKSQGDKDFLSQFGDWRAAVFLVESRNAGRVEVLLMAARVLDGFKVEYPQHARDLESLETFVSVEWGISVYPIRSMSEAQRFAPIPACDLVTCPSYLRTMSDTSYVPPTRKRGGEPTRLQGSWMKNFDDDHDRSRGR